MSTRCFYGVIKEHESGLGAKIWFFDPANSPFPVQFTSSLGDYIPKLPASGRSPLPHGKGWTAAATGHSSPLFPLPVRLAPAPTRGRS